MSCEEYLKDISRAPLLTNEEEVVLGNTVQLMIKLLRLRGITCQLSLSNINEVLERLDRPERKIVKNGIKARNRIISANMRLVVAIAKKYVKKQVHMGMQDLIQEGAIGLTRAAEKFEPCRGYKFSTYAYLWIKQAITRGCEAQEGMIKLPCHLQRKIRQASEMRIRLLAELGREPSPEELSDKMGGEDPAKLKKIISMSALMSRSILSFDVRVQNDEGMPFCIPEVLRQDNDNEENDDDEDASRINFIMLAIQALDPVDKELIISKYGIDCEPASTNELAKKTGLTPQAVRERQQMAAAKIRYIVTNFEAPT